MAWRDHFRKEEKGCWEIFSSLCNFVVDMTKCDTLIIPI